MCYIVASVKYPASSQGYNSNGNRFKAFNGCTGFLERDALH